MKFKTINPALEEVISEYETMSSSEVFDIANACQKAYLDWKGLSLAHRIEHVKKLIQILKTKKSEYARIITLEMGKPINESISEIEKCAWMAEVYADNASAWLEEESMQADGKAHKVIFQPLGIILSVMPWNFPFWQALRFAVPTLLAGNVTILKHSNTVPGCALAIEDAFKQAGFPDNIFRTILADYESVSKLISSDLIRGVSFTGSTGAGMKLAELAGKNLKKTVLELGGSDPFIVLEDSDLERAAENAVLGRTINTGQSCIAAKRFIVRDEVMDEFSKRFAELMSKLIIGDPLDNDTQIGPLVNKETVETIERQVSDAINKGAKILTGGHRLDRLGYFFEPTVLINVKPDMAVFSQEVFGPVAPIISVKSDSEAIELANSLEFGLGGSVWTSDLVRGENIARQVESGTVFVNNITKSDPRMPFGGVKKSGIGRELAKYGLKEFVNIKGLNIYEQN